MNDQEDILNLYNLYYIDNLTQIRTKTENIVLKIEFNIKNLGDPY